MNQISLNHDETLIAFASQTGFEIFFTEPFRSSSRPTFHETGIEFISLLFSTNIIAFVADDQSTRFPQNHVIIWDHRPFKPIAQLKFSNPITPKTNPIVNLKLTGERIAICFMNHVSIYEFRSLKLLNQFETVTNPFGIFDISASNVVVTLTPTDGSIFIKTNFGRHIIPAHTSSIVCMKLNQEGTLLATASNYGTVIRVFDTMNGLLVHEFRRGWKSACILKLCFSSLSTYLACVSSTSIHIFTLSQPPSIFNIKWSFHSQHVLGDTTKPFAICFSKDETHLLWITHDKQQHKILIP